MTKMREVLKRIIELNTKIRRLIFSPDIVSKYSLGTRQMQTLFNLIGEDPMTMSSVASLIKVSNQQMTKIINTLVEKDYVERLYDPKNRRIVLIKITKEGVRNVESLYADMVNYLDQKGVPVDDEKLNEFLYHLGYVEDFIKEVQKYA